MSNFILFSPGMCVMLLLVHLGLSEKITSENCRQFHQCYSQKFFVWKSSRQLFSSYMYIENAAETMFVRKICVHNIDEIDTCNDTRAEIVKMMTRSSIAFRYWQQHRLEKFRIFWNRNKTEKNLYVISRELKIFDRCNWHICSCKLLFNFDRVRRGHSKNMWHMLTPSSTPMWHFIFEINCSLDFCDFNREINWKKMSFKSYFCSF